MIRKMTRHRFWFNLAHFDNDICAVSYTNITCIRHKAILYLPWALCCIRKRPLDESSLIQLEVNDLCCLYKDFEENVVSSYLTERRLSQPQIDAFYTNISINIMLLFVVHVYVYVDHEKIMYAWKNFLFKHT